MGVVPSRETLLRDGLVRQPSYGQRQELVLIPLTKNYFPSSDSPLFKQFCEARCDPFVRYYHRKPFNERADVIPDVPGGADGLYELYVGTTEKAVYGTDKEFLNAVQALLISREKMESERGKSVLDRELNKLYVPIKPIPCAVAFVYSKSTASVSPENINLDESRVQIVGCVGCQELDNIHIKTTMSTVALRLFLTKSAGDHSRIHILLLAAYTFLKGCRGMGVIDSPILINDDGSFQDKVPFHIPLPPVYIGTFLTNLPELCFVRELRCRAAALGMDPRFVTLWLSSPSRVSGFISSRHFTHLCFIFVKYLEEIHNTFMNTKSAKRGLKDQGNSKVWDIALSKEKVIEIGRFTCEGDEEKPSSNGESLHQTNDYWISGNRKNRGEVYCFNGVKWNHVPGLFLEEILIAVMKDECIAARHAPENHPNWVRQTKGDGSFELLHEETFYLWRFNRCGIEMFYGVTPMFAKQGKKERHTTQCTRIVNSTGIRNANCSYSDSNTNANSYNDNSKYGTHTSVVVKGNENSSIRSSNTDTEDEMMDSSSDKATNFVSTPVLSHPLHKAKLTAKCSSGSDSDSLKVFIRPGIYTWDWKRGIV